MELSKEEFQVLWSIEEGMSNLQQAHIYTGFDKHKLKKIYNKLEKLGLIVVTKKFDKYYKEDFWDAKTTKKAKPLYKKYQNRVSE